MKPRLYLKHAFHDCGWRYEHWECYSWAMEQIGRGATPEKAYDDWARQVNADGLETVA